MKICPECKDSNNLAWSWACFPDAGDPQTTDCMGCGRTWEEWECDYDALEVFAEEHNYDVERPYIFEDAISWIKGIGTTITFVISMVIAYFQTK